MNHSEKEKRSDPQVGQPSVQHPPVRLLIIVVLLVFVSEAFVMVVLSFLPSLSALLEVLLDSTLLVILLSPALYLVLFHPLIRYITERKRTEQALRESEERFREILEHSPDAIYKRNLRTGRYQYVSPAITDIVGYTPQEVMAMSTDQIDAHVHPENREQLKQLKEQWTRERQAHPVSGVAEYRVRCKDGVYRWIADRFTLLPGPDGQPLFSISSIRDITGRKRMERAFEERQLYLEGVLSAAPDGIVTLDTEHRIVEWNQGAEMLFGYSQEEVAGQGLDQLVAGPDPMMLDQATGFTQQVLAGEPVPPTETVRYRKDGTPVDVIVAGAPIQVEDELVGVVAVYTDITQRKRMEETLRRRAEELAMLQATVLDITTRRDLPALLHTIVERAAQLLDAPSGGMYLCDPERKETRCAVSYNTPDDYTGTVLQYGEGAAGTVLETGDPLIIDDYRTWDRRAAVYEEDQPFTAVLSTPMTWQGEVTGVIHVLHDVETRRFTQADLELLTLFANHAAIAVENTRLYEEIRQRAAQLEALQEVGLEITAQLDLEELLHSIASQAIELLGGVGGGLYLYRPEQDTLEFVTAVGRQAVSLGSILHRGEGLSGKVWESGDPLVVGDYRHWEGRALQYEELPIAAVVGVPIRWGGEFLGVLTTEDEAPDSFSSTDAELLSLFATQAAIAIRNARLYEETERRATQARLIYEVGQHVSTELEPDVLLPIIVSAVRDAFDYYNVILLLLDEGTDRLAMQSIAGVYADVLPDDLSLAVGEGMIGYAAATGETQISNDVSTDPHYVRKAAEDTQSELAVPIKSGQKVIGVLDLQDDEPNAFDEIDVTTVETLSTQIATAIENAHLFQAERERSTQLATVSKVAESITSTLDPHEVLHRTVELITQAFGYYYASIMLLDLKAGELVFEAGAGGFAGRTPPDFRQKLKKGMIGWAAHLGETMLANDVSQEPHYIPAYLSETQSELDVPLKYRNRVIGVLDLQSRELNAFDEHDVIAMEALAGHVAAAIENARLYEETHQRALEQETLREAALALTTTLDRDEVVDRILAQLQEVVPYDTASVQLLRDDLLAIVGGRGFPNLEELLGVTFDPSREDNPNREVVRTRTPLIVEDAPEVYKEFLRDPHAAAGTRSWLGVPMLVGDRLIGMIALDKSEPGFYTEEHARLAETFAAQAAIAIENSRLFQAEKEQRELAQALEAASAAVSSALDLDEVLDRILEQVARVVVGDAFNVMLVEEGTARVVRRRGYESVDIGSSATVLSITEHPILKKMVQSGAPLVVPDTMSDPDWIQTGEQAWWRSYLGAPIQVSGLTVGFLNVNSTRPNQFSPEDARRLAAFADHAATAIENAQLYQELQGYAGELEDRVAERTAQLQAQFAQLEAVLDSTADGVIVIGPKGEPVLANPVARNWLKQTLSPEEAERLRETVRDLAARAEERPRQVLELTGLDLELSAAPIIEGDVEQARAVVAIHDVSHLKALDRMKSRFVSNISHELRTPIATIKLYAHLMETQPENWREYLELLAKEADHQAQLVEDILEISRVDAGRLEVKPRPTDLNALIDILIENHKTPIQERGLTLKRRTMETGPTALLDPQRTMQVLNNLTSNAIRYTPEGGSVTIATGKAEAQGRLWATVTVKDTGMGIPEEEQPHIFDRFFRGEEPRTMQISGTGLGLAIVKEIVELHGGRVTVESEVDVGSTFTVWLPLPGE